MAHPLSTGLMIPILQRDQVREIDRRAIEHWNMSGLVLMENAGRGVVDVLEKLGIEGQVTVCCGKGNNAGDGLVMARHLALRGYQTIVLLFSNPFDLSPDAKTNYEILKKTSVPIHKMSGTESDEQILKFFNRSDWLVDALLGTGATGPLRPPFDQAVRNLNQATGKRLAVDMPSGLDCDTGKPSTVTFCAHHTCTFVALKPGLVTEGADQFTGKVHVLDIGVPMELIAEVCHERSIFGR